jgi:MYXO-CTERM domain-containing protein
MGLPRLIAGTLAGLVLLACGASPSDVEHALASSALRPDMPSGSEPMFRFDASDMVEAFDAQGGHVRVHFSRAGRHAVSAMDADGDELPDDVSTLAELYEQVLAHHRALGFREPVADDGTPGGDGGDGRLDVYMLDFAGQADGSFVREACAAEAPSRCSGYVVQENDFLDYGYPSFASGTRTLASHELFHALQAAYDADQGANFSEATAVWASEHFDPALDDFERQIAGWLASPERAIDQEPIGPVDPYSYGLALYFKYLEERFGAQLIRELWEGCADGAGGQADPHWLDVLVARLEQAYGTSFRETWLEYAGWVLHAGLEGQEGLAFAQGAHYTRVARRALDLPHAGEPLRMFHASMRAFTFVPGARAQVSAALVPSKGSEGFADLGLLLAVRKGKELTVVQGTHEATLSADTTGADELIVLVANGAAKGSSLAPRLCVGSAEELASCTQGTDASDQDAGAGEAHERASGGCSVTGANARAQLAVWLLAATLPVAWRRRRARARTQA